MTSIIDLIETLEYLEAVLRQHDGEQGFEAITILLMQITDAYGHDSALMSKLFPLLEEIKDQIQQSQFDDALTGTSAFLSMFQKVREVAPAPQQALRPPGAKIAWKKSESPTAILSAFVQDQARSDPALAEKVEHLISTLRSQLGSDELVVEKLAELFGFKD